MDTNMTCNSKIIEDPGLYQKPPDLIPDTLSSVRVTGSLTIPEDLTQEDIHSVITVARVENFCRICGMENDQNNLVYIFGASGNDLELQRKIIMHLHLQVDKDDQLPQQVCNNCVCHLNICHQLFEISHAANSKLRQLFLLPQMTENGELCLNMPIDIITDLEALHDEVQPEVHIEDGEASTSEIKSCVNKEQDSSVQSNIHLFEGKNSGTPENTKSVTVEKVENLASLLCDVCGKHFKAPANLQVHKRTHLDESLKKKHHCSVCSKSFRSHFHLSEHMNYHRGVKPYSCNVCGKGFHSTAQLRQHTEVHAQDEKKHVCTVCGVRFNRRSNMRLHLKIHAEGRSFRCRLCSQTFPTLNAMMSHRKSHSQEDIKRRLSLNLVKNKDCIYTCEVCGKVLTDKRSLATHLDLHRQEESSGFQYKCEDCGKVLRSRQTLAYHRQSQHSIERRFHCSYCSEGYMTQKLLQAHERTHTGEKPFKCEVCWKGFRSRSNLAQHMMKHKGERNFECTICGKCFFRRGALTVHHRKHTGEKPFICDICGRPFSQKNDMLKHQRSHSSCDGVKKQITTEVVNDSKDTVNVIPLIITNNVFETHIITEDGQKIVFTSVEALGDVNTETIPSNIV
ncbi:zinc finger protein 260-like isoform X2 [Homalodisca vitripennis]|uniref:zinc finger protein 260-like isoform X2 n=1 Tax=Homalodisca vitripennis TaxID=197043 RepID=UPI001EEB7673|nr:zinc finger protein 260-like isoform X2 [Homalodisca vitripennis]